MWAACRMRNTDFTMLSAVPYHQFFPSPVTSEPRGGSDPPGAPRQYCGKEQMFLEGGGKILTARVGLDKASLQTHGSPQPASHAVLQAQVLQQGTRDLLPSLGEEQGLESHFHRPCVSPSRYGCEAAPSRIGIACPQHCQPCPSSPSPCFQSAGLSADLTPRTVLSSGGTNLAAVTESKEKSRPQITPRACNQENASIEQSNLLALGICWQTFVPAIHGCCDDLSSGLRNKTALTRYSSYPPEDEHAHKFGSQVRCKHQAGASLSSPGVGGTLALPAPHGYGADVTSFREQGLPTHISRAATATWGREMCFSSWNRSPLPARGQPKRPCETYRNCRAGPR